MKKHILRILRANDAGDSCEALSKRLGISIVAVGKHIRELQECGYPIVSASKGYQLTGYPDALYPWEFPERESNIVYFPEVSSTMDIARDMARKGCPDFTVVIAERQHKGRGRLSRKWLSPLGGLYFTVIVRPQISVLRSSRINFAASLSLAKILRTQFHVEAFVKWPNDILVGKKKLSGMLSELAAEGDSVSYINIGIGINVNNASPPEELNAVSLKEILGKEIYRRDVLSAFLDEFEGKLKNFESESIISEWKNYTTSLNRHVRIITIQKTFEGYAMDVDENGALMIRLNDGSIHAIHHGDCFHRVTE